MPCTGLDYLNNRYHDPVLGAFISVDPLVTMTGDAYVYGHANPILFSDPSGLIYDNPDGSYTKETAQVFATAHALRQDGIAFTLTHSYASISEGGLFLESYDSWVLRVVNDEGLGWEEGSHFHTTSGAHSGRRGFSTGYKVGSVGSTCGRWCNAGKIGVFAVSAIAFSGCTVLSAGTAAAGCGAAVGAGSAWANGAMEGEFGLGWDELIGGILGGAGGYLAHRAPNTARVVTTGQEHHVISRRIAAALDDHPTLAGAYTPRDPRFVTQAIDDAAHRGYQTWHRQLDAEVADWLARNPNATTTGFEQFLRQRYGQADLLARFPNGF